MAVFTESLDRDKPDRFVHLYRIEDGEQISVQPYVFMKNGTQQTFVYEEDILCLDEKGFRSIISQDVYACDDKTRNILLQSDFIDEIRAIHGDLFVISDFAIYRLKRLSDTFELVDQVAFAAGLSLHSYYFNDEDVILGFWNQDDQIVFQSVSVMDLSCKMLPLKIDQMDEDKATYTQLIVL